MRSGSKSYIQRLSQTYMLSLEVLIQQRWLEPQLRPTCHSLLSALTSLAVEVPPPPVFSGTPLAATPPEASEASPCAAGDNFGGNAPTDCVAGVGSPAFTAGMSFRVTGFDTVGAEIPAGPTCAGEVGAAWEPGLEETHAFLEAGETAGDPGNQRAVSRERQHDDVWAIWPFRPRGWVLWVVLRETVE